MGLSNTFGTDKGLEKNGVVQDYGTTRIRIARAGGSNMAYTRAMERLFRPHRRQSQAGTLEEIVAMRLLREAYAESVIMSWETKTGTDEQGNDIWEHGISPEDAGHEPSDKLLPVNKDTIMAVFNTLPDLFLDLKAQAESLNTFKLEVMEADAKN